MVMELVRSFEFIFKKDKRDVTNGGKSQQPKRSLTFLSNDSIFDTIQRLPAFRCFWIPVIEIVSYAYG